MLAEKLSAYRKREPIPQITPAKYKEEFSFLKEVDSLALANVQLQLEKAFRNHLKNPQHFGLPKFKKIELHRTLEGKIKSATVSKTKDGRFYVSILVETEEPRNKVIEPKSKTCGIDLGLEHFATISNDFRTRKIEHPKHLRKAKKRLKNYEKAKACQRAYLCLQRKE
jgi:putative transposase